MSKTIQLNLPPELVAQLDSLKDKIPRGSRTYILKQILEGTLPKLLQKVDTFRTITVEVTIKL